MKKTSLTIGCVLLTGISLAPLACSMGDSGDNLGGDGDDIATGGSVGTGGSWTMGTGGAPGTGGSCYGGSAGEGGSAGGC